MIDSIGLPGRGLAFLPVEHNLSALAQLPVPLKGNVMGSTPEEVSKLPSRRSRTASRSRRSS